METRQKAHRGVSLEVLLQNTLSRCGSLEGKPAEFPWLRKTTGKWKTELARLCV